MDVKITYHEDVLLGGVRVIPIIRMHGVFEGQEHGLEMVRSELTPETDRKELQELFEQSMRLQGCTEFNYTEE